MTFKPKFNFTNEMVTMLSKIEYARGLVNDKTIPLHVSYRLKNMAKVKSAHYSTYIESNSLTMAQVEQLTKKRTGKNENYQQQEARNYWRALTFLAKAKARKIPISGKFIKRLHKIIEVRKSGRRGKYSKYRGATPPGVLFCVKGSVTGNIEYIPPAWEDVPTLMDELVAWLSTEKTLPVPIKAAITAYQLVTIHPFDDGNGRLARALSLYVLMLNDYDLDGYFTVEEYYAKNIQLYYSSLQMGLPANYYDGRNSPDLTPWIVFYLSTMQEAFETITSSVIRLHKASAGKLLELSPKEVKLLQLALRFEGRPLTLELMSEWFEVSKRTMQEWVKDWVAIELLEPATGKKRITSYVLGKKYQGLKWYDLP